MLPLPAILVAISRSSTGIQGLWPYLSLHDSTRRFYCTNGMTKQCRARSIDAQYESQAKSREEPRSTRPEANQALARGNTWNPAPELNSVVGGSKFNTCFPISKCILGVAREFELISFYDTKCSKTKRDTEKGEAEKLSLCSIRRLVFMNTYSALLLSLYSRMSMCQTLDLIKWHREDVASTFIKRCTKGPIASC